MGLDTLFHILQNLYFLHLSSEFLSMQNDLFGPSIDRLVAKGKLFHVEKKIASHPNIYAVYDTTGHFDATIIAKFKNTRSMDNFLKKYRVMNLLKEQKQSWF